MLSNPHYSPALSTEIGTARFEAPAYIDSPVLALFPKTTGCGPNLFRR